MFETDRLRLRAICKADFEKLTALQNDYRVQSMLTLDHVAPRGPKYEETILKVSEELFYAIVETKEDKEFVGFAMLFNLEAKNRDARLGMALVPEFWGRGYATEILRFVVDYAFRELALHRVTLNVFGNNAAAIRVYTKVGFVREGIERKKLWAHGAWHDVIWMAILDEEWTAWKKKEESA
ncbi:hypothetical protein GYMLUDRAFT_151062 [Collybiopsis luxurians FD-317 M1]|nr:hypothetical protein GYMLUDRAFT_151062 [Collybiopsis luxurians FD-317 M1]